MPFTFAKDSTNKAGSVRATTDGNNFYVPSVLFGSDGVTPISSLNPLQTKSTTINNQLIAPTKVTWNAIKMFDYINVPISNCSNVFIFVDNTNQLADLNATFELQTTAGVWVPWADTAGFELSFNIEGGSKKVYGAFPCFSKYLSSRIKLSSLTAPVNTAYTIVQVQEVA